MTYSLPFGLKQKPLTKYFNGGVIKFNIVEGKLFYTVKVINKGNNSKLFVHEIKSKEQLDLLLSIKTFSEIPTIEEVVQQ